MRTLLHMIKAFLAMVGFVFMVVFIILALSDLPLIRRNCIDQPLHHQAYLYERHKPPFSIPGRP